MEAELKSLEGKLAQLVTLCHRLRSDNHALRQQLATALNDSKQLAEKITQARNRLETLVNQIPDDESVGTPG
jgi:cell division protein ZapB